MPMIIIILVINPTSGQLASMLTTQKEILAELQRMGIEFIIKGSSTCFSTLVVKPILEHPLQLVQKLCHFATPNANFIILPHHFTTSHLSDVL